MKKSLLALAALGAFAGTAQAQSSVTLYGVVDANIEYVSNMSSTAAGTAGFPGRGENKFGVTSGGLSGSRWGLRGVEDLGGGMKALFVLESGFGVDDGRMQQGGRLFGRQDRKQPGRPHHLRPPVHLDVRCVRQLLADRLRDAV